MEVIRIPVAARVAARRRLSMTRDDLVGLLLFPFYLVVAIAAIPYWIIAALIRGRHED